MVSIRPRHCLRTIPVSRALGCHPQRNRKVASLMHLLLRWTDALQTSLTEPREICVLKTCLARILVIEQMIVIKLMQDPIKARTWCLRRCLQPCWNSWNSHPHPPQSNVRILHPSALPSSCQRRLPFACIPRLFRLSKKGASTTATRQLP
jgi:hypothetical protein